MVLHDHLVLLKVYDIPSDGFGKMDGLKAFWITSIPGELSNSLFFDLLNWPHILWTSCTYILVNGEPRAQRSGERRNKFIEWQAKIFASEYSGHQPRVLGTRSITEEVRFSSIASLFNRG